MELRCPNCAEAVSATDQFCGTCGAALPVPGAPRHPLPPREPPPPPPVPRRSPTDPPPPGPRDRSWLPTALAVAVLVGGLAGWIVLQDTKDAVTFLANEVYLEPLGVVEYAFTPGLLASAAMHEIPGPPTTLTLTGAAEVALVKGSDELNYAGARGGSGCDAEILLDHLGGEPNVSRAWAEAQGIEPEEVAGFVTGLTPMLLTRDVRVTTHVLADGRPIPRQALLQRGTAVLVGPTGEPRVRCASGSPLNLPVFVATPTYVGVAWTGFDPTDIVGIEPCDEPLTQFVLQDTATGEIFVRPVGTTEVSATDTTVAVLEPTTTTQPQTTTTTTEPPTTTTTTTVPAATFDITNEGTVEASSRLCGSFAASFAVDHDLSTSWISHGTDDGVSMFEWTGTQEDFIALIEVHSNAEHRTAKYRTDHGFATITIQVFDAAGKLVYEERVNLPDTSDPDVLVYPRVIGQSVVVLGEGHQSSTGAGFAEFIVSAARG